MGTRSFPLSLRSLCLFFLLIFFGGSLLPAAEENAVTARRAISGPSYYGVSPAYKSGDVLHIEIQVDNPGPAAKWVRIAENFPAGWKVSNLGFPARVSKTTIAWNLYVPARYLRPVSYDLTAPADADDSALFSGAASGAAIGGVTSVPKAKRPAAPPFVSEGFEEFGRIVGESSFQNNSYTLKGHGLVAENYFDVGFFLYARKTGSWQLEAKVKWVDSLGSPDTQAGLMIRDTDQLRNPTIYARFYMIGLRGDGRVAVWWRDANQTQIKDLKRADGTPVRCPGEGIWLRVTHIELSGVFLAEYSTDGENWLTAHSYVHAADWHSCLAYCLTVSNYQDNDQLAVAEFHKAGLQPYPQIVARRSFAGRNFSVLNPFRPGDCVTVSLLLSNPGDKALSASLTETVPGGWAVDEISDGGVLSSGTLAWKVPVPLGGQRTVTYRVKAPAESAAAVSFRGDVNGMTVFGDSTLSKINGAVGLFDSHLDIGDVERTGNALFDVAHNSYSVDGSGAGIGWASDEFHYLFKQVQGPVRIRAYVEFDLFESSSEWAWTGLMFRDSLTASSPHYSLLTRPDYLAGVVFRTSTGGPSELGRLQNWYPEASNNLSWDWDGLFELIYDGKTLHSYLVTNEGRKEVYSRAMSMPGPNYVGLAVTSNQDGALSKGLFSKVQVTEYDVYAERSVSSETISAYNRAFSVQVTAHVTPGLISNATLTDTISSGLDVIKLYCSNGSVTKSGNTVTWKLNEATGDVSLSYVILAPSGMANQSITLNGSIGDLPVIGQNTIYPLTFQVPFNFHDASLDGVISPGEYGRAYKETFSHAEGDMTAPGVHIFDNAYPASEESATFYIYHSQAYIYVAVDVMDKVALDFDSNATDDWQCDSAELFIDGNLSRLHQKERNRFGFQATVVGNGLRANGNDAPAAVPLPGGGGWSNFTGDYWDYAAKEKTDGYVVEYRVKKAEILDPPTRKVIGFDILINSAEGTGSRTGRWGFWNTPIGGYASGVPVFEYWDDETGWAIMELLAPPIAGKGCGSNLNNRLSVEDWALH